MNMKTVLPLTLGLAACATTPAPRTEVAGAIAAVRGAEVAGAREIPEAALHLKLAEEQVESAEELIEAEKNQRALSVALRARQDAELAIAMAHERETKEKLETFTSNHPRVTAEQQVHPKEPVHAP